VVRLTAQLLKNSKQWKLSLYAYCLCSNDYGIIYLNI
jgi:hypothetical protein